MVLNDIIRQMNERGYNVYASLDENGESLKDAYQAIANGLVLPYEEFFKRREEGQSNGIVPIDFCNSDRTLFMIAPQISDPNSPEKVFEKIKELEKLGEFPRGQLGTFSFRLSSKDVITPQSFRRLSVN